MARSARSGIIHAQPGAAETGSRRPKGTHLSTKTSGLRSRPKRDAQRAAPRPAQPPTPPVTNRPTPRWRSPRALAIGAVVVIAVVAIGAFVAFRPPAAPGRPQPAAPGTSTSAGILVPAVGTPTNIAFQRTLGRPDAPVRLIVWSDFQCAGCKDFAESSLPHLITDFVIPGKLRIEFRDLAVVGPESAAAAAAARCADQQNRFWPYHDVLFANQGPEETGQLSPARLKDMADAIGLDRTAFDACLPSGDVFNAVQTETAAGKDRGDAAPVLDFTSVVISGSEPYDTLKQTVEQLLANAPTPAPPSIAGTPSASP